MSLRPLFEEFEESEILNQSWERCYHYGLAPDGPVHDQLITGPQLQEIVREHTSLIQHATAILEGLHATIRTHELIVIIVNHCGIIVHTVGAPSFSLKDAHFIKGAIWTEKQKGTNAMGVALQEEKAVRVHAEQHFYIRNQFLTCAASPIYSATGQLLGAVNISTRKEYYHPFLFSLTVMIAESIQNRLLLEQAKQEHLFTLQELQYTSDMHALPLITMDHERRIIRANQAAQSIFGTDCIGQEFYESKEYKIHTIADKSRKTWRSVAMYKEKVKQPEPDGALYTFDHIIGSCPKIVRTKELGRKAASSEFPILIYGESGTGKELLAQSIHTASARANEPFIAVNCSAIPESLVESELFGYERGAFTGANPKGGKGHFEAANGGTIFLDEIGDMSLRSQSALLRVLQEKMITRVGGSKAIPIHVRVIAATNRNLLQEAKEGRFREDLYYRLKGIHFTLPSLRERTDILELARYLLSRFDNQIGSLSDEAARMLEHYHWPGNIRELNSILMQASFLAEGATIRSEHLIFESGFKERSKERAGTVVSIIDAEREAIMKSLEMSEWNISKAAKLLQIGRNTLYRKLKEYGIT